MIRWRACSGVGAVVVATIISAGCLEGSPQPYVRLDGPAPLIENAPIARAVLVSFWATWCVPCRIETPDLQALAQRPPSGLVVMVASHDSSMATVEAFFGGPPDAGLHLRLDTERQLARALNVETLPASILIVEGRLVARFEGRRRWNSAAERGLLAKLIEP